MPLAWIALGYAVLRRRLEAATRKNMIHEWFDLDLSNALKVRIVKHHAICRVCVQTKFAPNAKPADSTHGDASGEEIKVEKYILLAFHLEEVERSVRRAEIPDG